jgi:hypothetical protein
MDLKNGTQKRAEKSTTNRPQIHPKSTELKSAEKRATKLAKNPPKGRFMHFQKQQKGRFMHFLKKLADV